MSLEEFIVIQSFDLVTITSCFSFHYIYEDGGKKAHSCILTLRKHCVRGQPLGDGQHPTGLERAGSSRLCSTVLLLRFVYGITLCCH